MRYGTGGEIHERNDAACGWGGRLGWGKVWLTGGKVWLCAGKVWLWAGKVWLFAWALAICLGAGVCVGQAGRGGEPSAEIGAGLAPGHAERVERYLRGRRGAGGLTGAELLDRARQEHRAMLGAPRASALGAAWTAVGPGQVVSGTYGAVTGRVTSLAIDPADATGNTLYVGTTGGGVWKSTNAAGTASAVSFSPLTDTLPVFSANAGTSATASLSIGALGVGNGVVLAGTGDPNDALDSYYGSGLLRSADGGVTWTLVQGSKDGVAGNHSFFGLSFAGFAFSSANPSLMVAAVSQAVQGVIVNAPDLTNSVQGLYFSTDAGVTWQMASIFDGSQTVQTPLPSGGNAGGNAATAVVWNPLRKRFYAAVRFHGYYESSDGQTWLRLAHQPGAGLTTAACPTNPGSTGSLGCPVFRGALSVQPASGDLFALTVDLANRDQGLWRDACLATGSACASSTVLFASQLGLGLAGSSPLEVGSGSTEILQGDYNLALGAAALGADTIVYVGTIDLFRCSLATGCTLRNTTNAQNGCTNPAKVAGAQHAIATLTGTGGPLVYVGNDGGIYRSADGANESGAVCSAGDAAHFQDLNGGIGSLAEVVSFAQHPSDPATLLVGLGALGTAGTGVVQSGWGQLATGEGGTVAIDAANPLNWYVSTGAGVSIGRCAKGSACTAADFAGQAVIGAAQVSNDISAIDAPWILDPALTSDVVIGTCRVWRGAAASGASWPGANGLSRPFGAAAASACGSTSPVVRSLGAGGAVSAEGGAQNLGSEVLYAGLAGAFDGGAGLAGHLFTTAAANTASAATVWTDAALAKVTNDVADSGLFNPGGFDVSSVTVDPHDATGKTVYATVMGFAGNGVNAPHVYRSVDGGGHWLVISSNLPNAPANSLVVDPNDANTVYVALDTGVYVTTQVTTCGSGNCWSVYGLSLPNAPVVELEAAPAMATGDGRTGELRAATYGRGIWQIPLLTALNATAPAMAVSPATINFGGQQVGTSSATQTVTVTDSGNAPLIVSGATTSGDFFVTNGCAGPIAPGASCAVQVGFLPSAIGARTGLLTVYGNVPGGQATVALSGTGTTAASIVLTPVSVVFAATLVGATSAVQNITISNTGGSAASLQTEGVSGDFRISANTCGTALAANTGCTVSIVFMPAAAGVRTGTLTVVDQVGTQTATLQGSGNAGATDGLAPLTLSFAAEPLNTASAAQTVTLTNSGDVALTLIAAQITSGDFTVVNGCGNSLVGHASCALAVTFAPKSLGGQSGVLTVADQFRSQTVALNGTGVAPAGISLAPAGGVSFVATAVGTLSGTQMATLTNNGAGPLSVSGVAVSGDFLVISGSNTCGASVAAGTACTVQIGFQPAAGGVRSGVLTVSSNAAGSPETLALSGVGVDFSLAANGPVAATIASGQSATYGLLLSSAAGVPGTAAFTCSGVPINAKCTVNPGSVGLGVNTPMTVTIATGVSSAGLEWPKLWSAVEGLRWAALVPLCWLGLRRRRRFGAVCLLLVSGCLLSGCGVARTVPATGLGGGGGGGGTTLITPSGLYNITVAGTSVGLVRSVGLSLTVQ